MGARAVRSLTDKSVRQCYPFPYAGAPMQGMSRAATGRRRRQRRALGGKRIAALAALVAVAGVAGWFLLLRSDEPPGPPTAAIVDQLSLTFPNEEFVREATAKLEAAGYTVDYFPGEEVTVSFYRRLPTRGYDLILFRSHADRLQATTPAGELVDEVILFTSEPYTTERYQSEQAANDLVIARYRDGGEPYFGIGAGFIDNGAGDYDGATIIMMGCEGLLTERTAEAFVGRGAEVYISWDETVSAAHTDAATDVLLQYLLIEGLTAADAVAMTMAEVGPDPFYDSELAVYPAPG